MLRNPTKVFTLRRLSLPKQKAMNQQLVIDLQADIPHKLSDLEQICLFPNDFPIEENSQQKLIKQYKGKKISLKEILVIGWYITQAEKKGKVINLTDLIKYTQGELKYKEAYPDINTPFAGLSETSNKRRRLDMYQDHITVSALLNGLHFISDIIQVTQTLNEDSLYAIHNDLVTKLIELGIYQLDITRLCLSVQHPQYENAIAFIKDHKRAFDFYYDGKDWILINNKLSHHININKMVYSSSINKNVDVITSKQVIESPLMAKELIEKPIKKPRSYTKRVKIKDNEEQTITNQKEQQIASEIKLIEGDISLENLPVSDNTTIDQVSSIDSENTVDNIIENTQNNVNLTLENDSSNSIPDNSVNDNETLDTNMANMTAIVPPTQNSNLTNPIAIPVIEKIETKPVSQPQQSIQTPIREVPPPPKPKESPLAPVYENPDLAIASKRKTKFDYDNL